MKLSTAALLAMAVAAPTGQRAPYGEAMRPGRMHDTKPHENTEEARARKKAERQRKKEARKASRRRK